MAEISLWLDSYNDVFSDFDSRNYSKRRVSEDFIEELQTLLKYKPEHLEDLVLLLPPHNRKQEKEMEITANLKEEMHKRFEHANRKNKTVHKKGLEQLGAGILIMAAGSMLIYNSQASFWLILARVIFEPAGWFLMWNGLDSLFYEKKETQKELKFYDILEHIKIHFKSI